MIPSSAQTLCLFSSYFSSGESPYYIRYYLTELCRHCSKVVFITNEKTLPADSEAFLKAKQIDCFFVKNEGYDFGMWAKALDRYPPEAYARLILVNDSCILAGKLDDALERIAANQWDYAGLLSSEEIAHHIQAYFLVLSPAAYPVLRNYFNEKGILPGMREVIHGYEVGLSTRMQEMGLKTGAVYSPGVSERKFNPVYSDVEALMKKGFPLIKKKILFDTFSFRERISLARSGVKTGSGFYMQLLEKQLNQPGREAYPEVLKKDRLRYTRPVKTGIQKIFISLYRLLRKLK